MSHERYTAGELVEVANIINAVEDYPSVEECARAVVRLLGDGGAIRAGRQEGEEMKGPVSGLRIEGPYKSGGLEFSGRVLTAEPRQNGTGEVDLTLGLKGGDYLDGMTGITISLSLDQVEKLRGWLSGQ